MKKTNSAAVYVLALTVCVIIYSTCVSMRDHAPACQILQRMHIEQQQQQQQTINTRPNEQVWKLWIVFPNVDSWMLCTIHQYHGLMMVSIYSMTLHPYHVVVVVVDCFHGIINKPTHDMNDMFLLFQQLFCLLNGCPNHQLCSPSSRSCHVTIKWRNDTNNWDLSMMMWSSHLKHHPSTWLFRMMVSYRFVH